MTGKPVKIPGPDHPIAIEPSGNRVRVTVAGRVVADSKKALSLREASYSPVLYIPREDIDLAAFEKTDHSSYCPYKGDAGYFSVPAGGSRAKNAAWTYEAPYESVLAIKDYVAFYPDRVDAIEIT